ncbi:MAG: undecaprenyl-diphosphate phosphatase [Campylobacterales bacterium]|nr:undecaprenyl-diphosphate phosphatase [Campylobacterales bacterium]
MEWYHAIVLALVQGLTEFLPISSSAHLILVPEFLHWEDQGLAFDVAVHVGSLLAVVLYFWRDVWALLRDWCVSLWKRQPTGESPLAWMVIIGTIPVGLAGLFLGDVVEVLLRSPSVIAYATLGFGLLLYVADRKGGVKELGQLTLSLALVIGVFQALALIPGASRSGVTITAALLFGFSRVSAARFSFLLSIPVIVLAGGLKGMELLALNAGVQWEILALGAGVSAVSAYGCIAWFMALIAKTSMTPFVVYRFGLGMLLLGIFGFWA